MFQTFGKYEVTARENIAIGDISVDRHEAGLAEAAAAGLADAVVRELPDGYDTKLGREFVGAHQLSGGQWQRVALSRWFFRAGADLLVLDEPTAAMDLAAEARVVDALEQLGSSRTLIIASHRPEVVRLATRVVVLDHGRVVEDGPPTAVTQRGGHGAQLFQLDSRTRGAA